MQPVMKLADWKAKIGAGEDPGSIVLRKAFIADEIKEIEGAERTLLFTISTASVDREKDTIAVKGWDTTDFQRTGGPVLWAHDYHTPPIGRAVSTFIEGDTLRSRAEFMTRDLSPFADTIYRMLVAKFLKSTSVGFRPDEYSFDEKRGGVNFIRQQLLEFSIVPIPANPDCVIAGRSLGIDTEPLKLWAEEVLDTWHQEKGLWVSKTEWEQFHKAADDTQKTVTVGSLSVVVDDPEQTDITDVTDVVTLELDLDEEDALALAERIKIMVKQGRVLSAANEGKIRAAVASLSEVLSALETVTDDGDKAAEPEHIKEVDEANDIDLGDFSTVLRLAIQDELREQLTPLTGRVY